MLSPYSDRTGDLFSTLNQQFANLLTLNTPYTHSEVMPGERYGFLDVRSLSPDRDDVRTGYAIDTFSIEILVSAGCENFSQAVGLSASLMIELAAAIPLLKRTLQEGSIHDVVVKGDIVAVKRQTLKPPHSWIVDTTCEMIAPIAIYRNMHGEHIVDDGIPLG